jgi:exopolyphosphatase/guanosine-5'-triphosphate,3'-diphosphate pyrophosphatase
LTKDNHQKSNRESNHQSNQVIDVLENANTRDVEKIAALDLGSNSFHLVVARVVAGSLQIVHRVKQKVRLASGLDENAVLSEDAIQRGLDTLSVIALSLKGFEPDKVRIVATHTLRRATNANEFIKRALKILPYPIEVISGVEEARLIYNGVAHTHHNRGQQLVIDIGGGSTEFIIGDGVDSKLCRSLQMGCVSYTKRFFKNGEIKAKYFEHAITSAEQELELIEEKYRKLGWAECIGTSGTIRTLVSLCNAMEEGNDAHITLKQLKQLMKQCIQAGHVDALDFVELVEDRRPVLCAGLAILIGAFEALKIDKLHFSPAALREGVLYEMVNGLAHDDIRERTASSLVMRYDVDKQQALHVHHTCQHIYDQVHKDWKLSGKNERSLMSWAAMLHEIGMQINSRGIQRHSAYILNNVDMPGFNQEEQILLATLVRFQRKKIRVAEIPYFSQFNKHVVARLICIIRLATLLNVKRQENGVPDLVVNASKREINVHFPQNWLKDRPIISADLEREQIYLEALDLKLILD